MSAEPPAGSSASETVDGHPPAAGTRSASQWFVVRNVLDRELVGEGRLISGAEGAAINASSGGDPDVVRAAGARTAIVGGVGSALTLAAATAGITGPAVGGPAWAVLTAGLAAFTAVSGSRALRWWRTEKRAQKWTTTLWVPERVADGDCDQDDLQDLAPETSTAVRVLRAEKAVTTGRWSRIAATDADAIKREIQDVLALAATLQQLRQRLAVLVVEEGTRGPQDGTLADYSQTLADGVEGLAERSRPVLACLEELSAGRTPQSVSGGIGMSGMPAPERACAPMDDLTRRVNTEVARLELSTGRQRSRHVPKG